MRISSVIAIFTLASFTGAASLQATAADSPVAVEYYDLELNHFFVTAAADEIQALNSGRFFGWVATGLRFPVLAPGDLKAGSTPVCRFYGSPTAGLDSHFYSADPAECQRVLLKWPLSWLLESSDVFRAYLPDTTTGACPGDTTPIFRLWNTRSDVNHRYTDRVDVAQAMIDVGYIPEGYGTSSIPTAFCAPASATPTMSCTVSAASLTPLVGSNAILKATCNGNPTHYTWTGCVSSSASCAPTSAVPGTQIYLVTASNGSTSSAPAGISLAWHGAGSSTGVSCSLAPTNALPVAGSSTTLIATCTGNPISYSWVGCTSANNTCVATSPSAGSKAYSVSASNGSSTSAPAALNINWQAGAPPPGVSCALAASSSAPVVGSILTLTAACAGNPTNYTWVGCTSSASTCVDTSSVAATLTYSVTAGNAAGTSSPAAIAVYWQAVAPPGMPTSADFLPKAQDPRAAQPYGSSAGYSAMKRMANGQMIVFGMSHTGNENNAVETYDPVTNAWTVRIPHTVATWGPTGIAGRTFLGNRDNQVNMMLRPFNEYWVLDGEGAGKGEDGGHRGIVDTVNWRWKFIDDNFVWEPTGDNLPDIWNGVGEWIDSLNLGVVYGGTRGNPGDDLHIFVPTGATPRFTHKQYANAWGNPSFPGSEMLRYVSQSNWVRGTYLYIYGGIHQDRASVQTQSQTIYKLDVTNPDAPVMSVESVNTLPPDQAVKGDAVLGDYDALHDFAVVTDGARVNVYSYATKTWANVRVNTAADPYRLSPDPDGTGQQARWSPEVGQMIILGGNGRTYGLRLNYSTSPPPPPPPPPSAAPTITGFSATPTSIAPGASTVLNAVVANATSLQLDGVAITLPTTVTPQATHGYVLVAAGVAGTTPVSATATVTVTAGPPSPPPPPPPPFPPTGNLTLTATAVPFTGASRVLANSKHLDFARVGNRWYKIAGDHAPTGDPIDNAIPPNNYSASTFQGGRQEILSFNAVANDWRQDSPYYLPASYGVQGADPDDAYGIAVNGEIWVINSDTNRGIAQPPMAATQIDLQASICAYTPPSPQWPFGHWRIVAPKPQEHGGNRSWRGFYDPVRNRVVIPEGNGSMNFIVIDVANPTSYQAIPLGGDHFFITAGIAADFVGRKFYLYDIVYMELWQVDMDTFAKSKVANIPEVQLGTQSAVKIAWHPDLRAVVMNLVKTHAFEVDTGKLTSWTRQDGYIDALGIYVPTSTVFFDPDTRDIISIGMEDFNEGGGYPPAVVYWRLRIH